MVISDICIRRPVLATVVNLVVLLVGLVAYQRLPVREYPKIDEPVVTVETTYRGASAEIIESRVTKILEDSLAGIEGVDTLTSISRAENSQITVKFRLERNPDAAELVRAKTGRIVGSLDTLLMVMKGLPLAYQKDMQEDKEPIFDAAENLALCLAATAGMVRDMRPQTERLAQAAGAGFSTATYLADWLVRELRFPFRDAHHVTGRLVAQAEGQGVDLSGLTLAQMQAVEPRIHDGVFGVLTVAASVASRTSFGGTAPANVARMAAEWRARLA
jgi:hypothetical protein